MIGTVALPVWKSKEIAWLCMESLCRQFPPEGEWELIVFEEKHNEALGEEFFKSYSDRLRDVRCKAVLYISCPDKWPLSKKWIMISLMSHYESRYFCLCAADNYYSPYMIQDAERDILSADWVIFTRGYFYDFSMDKVFKYNFPSRIGLQMIARTELVRRFPMEIVNKGVDMWFSRCIGYNIMMNNSNHWKGILCTNGMNTISVERKEFFADPHPPFYRSRKKLKDIVPIDINIKLKELCQKLQLS